MLDRELLNRWLFSSAGHYENSRVDLGAPVGQKVTYVSTHAPLT